MMGFLKKLKEKTEETAKKGVDVGKKVGEKTIDLGKDVGEKGLDVGKKAGEKGIEFGKKGVQKVRDAGNDENDPLHILNIRYAKGEITKKQYEEMKQTLDS
jgi:hypothetical protein